MTGGMQRSLCEDVLADVRVRVRVGEGVRITLESWAGTNPALTLYLVSTEYLIW